MQILAKEREILKEAADQFGGPTWTIVTTSRYLALAQHPSNTEFDCQKIVRELSVSRPYWSVGFKQVLTDWKQR